MLEKIIKFLINRKVFAFFLMFSLFFAGIYSALLLPRESQPEVNVPIIIVKTVYVGSKAKTIESDITNKIEDEIDKIKKIEKITSTSNDDFSLIVVEFEQGFNVEKGENEVQKAVDNVKNKLPEEVEESVVSKVEVSNNPIYIFSLMSNENDYSFKIKLDDLKEKIEKINGVGEVVYTGASKYQYSVYLDPKKIEKYKLSASQVYQLLKDSNNVIPIGSIKMDNIEYPLEINDKIENISDLKNLPLLKDRESIVYLSDIAKIKKEFIEENNFSIALKNSDSSSKERSSVFYIKKEQDYNVQDVVNSIEDFISTERIKYQKNGSDFLNEKKIVVLTNWGEEITNDLVDLAKNGVMTTVLVFVLLLFILGFKDSLIASFGIPFSFVLAFIAFLIVGNTLNFISLFSLILSIGILVDSDIVMSEGIEKFIKKGYTKEEASVEAVKQLGTPMIAGTLTTIAVFTPLMFLSGTTGEFIRSIPFTVIFVLIASQLVSIFAIPVLHATNYSGFLKKARDILIFILVFVFVYLVNILFSYLFLNYSYNDIFKVDTFKIVSSLILAIGIFIIKKKDNIKENNISNQIKNFDKENKITFFEKIENLYKKILSNILKSLWKKIFLIVMAFAMFAFAIYLPKSGKIKTEFFPGGEVLFAGIDTTMPKGTSQNSTKKYLLEIMDLIKDENGITEMILTTGNTSKFLKTIKEGDRYGNIFLKLDKETQKKGKMFIEHLQEKIESKGFEFIKIVKSENGPPSGVPISFNVVGDDQEKVEEFSRKAENILKNIDGVINIENDLDKMKTSFEIDIDRAKAKKLGVTNSAISFAIRMVSEGVEVFEVNDSLDNDIDVVVLNNVNNSNTLKEFKKINIEDILNLRIKNNKGENIFLSEIASVSLKKYQSKIFHYNLENSIKIEAENKENYILTDIVDEFKEDFSKINKKEEVKLIFGGAFSKQQKNFAETMIIFLIGILIVFGILIFYFNSIWLPLLIESVILFAFTGSTIGLWITNNLISFPSMIGLIALSGVVVNNSIMLIDNYQKILRENKVKLTSKVKEKIVSDGSADRLRAILLTVLTTTIGIFPLVYSSPIWAPIVYVIIFGLLFSTFVTLFFIPVVFYWTLKENQK